MVQLNYNFVKEDVDVRYETEEELEDSWSSFFDGWSDDEIEDYYKWLDEEEEKERKLKEEYEKMDVNELERRDFIRKYPTTDCDGCGEIHNTEDMHIGIDATGEVVLVLCKKCANIK